MVEQTTHKSVVNRRELAEIMRTTETEIAAWMEDGMPYITKDEFRVTDVQEWFRVGWWYQHLPNAKRNKW